MPGSATDYNTVADVKPDATTMVTEGEQRRVLTYDKVTIRQRADYTPQIGDLILWRGKTMAITGIKSVIKQRNWWEFKTEAVHGQS